MKTKSKIVGGNFLEDFYLGQIIKHSTPRTITDGDAAVYISLTGARHSLHSSEILANELGYSKRPIDDFLLFNIAFGKTVPDISLNAVANLGYAEVQFFEPVYSGDTVHCESIVIGIKENASGVAGVVYVRSTCFNQNGNAVLTWVRWVMVKKRDHAANISTRHIPDLMTSVPSNKISVPSRIKDQETLGRIFEANGSQIIWEDFSVDEIILHPGGITIEDSDHMLATRLYQNNARAHFDAKLMAGSAHGKRLVYGGHIISICRALSFEGLDNSLSVSAINSGKHMNPTYSGDTIYCFTKVIEKIKIFGRSDVGAIRLGTIGIKNMSPEEFFDSKYENCQNKNNENIVLDIDYTTIFPRKGRSN